MAQIAAKQLGIKPEDVVVGSTGVIGQPLPLEPIQNSIADLAGELSDSPEGGLHFEEGIMTTDTQPKQVAVEFDLAGKKCTIGGCAKGSGMIHPNMATMLCFLTTDACITPELLQTALTKVVDDTFNMVSVDGDTSTNDTCCIMASGAAGNKLIDRQNEDFSQFVNALYVVLMNLSRMIAADGEGATRV